METFYHLFINYQATKKIWALVRSHYWFPSTIIPHVIDGRGILLFLYSSLNKVMLHKAIYIIWSIWKERNATIFKNKIFNPIHAIIRVKRESAEWRSRHIFSLTDQPSIPTSQPRKSYLFVRWKKPNEGFIKLNFNGLLIGHNVAGGYVL